MPLLTVSHVRQRRPADCLAACSAMVLAYLHIPFQYQQLIQKLQIRYFGAPFSNVRYLADWGLTVSIGEGTLAEVESYLASGLPVLVNVNTGELRSYWDRESSHVVVVVGTQGDRIFLNDPAFNSAPTIVDRAEFELAWDWQYQRLAVIELASE